VLEEELEDGRRDVDDRQLLLGRLTLTRWWGKGQGNPSRLHV